MLLTLSVAPCAAIARPSTSASFASRLVSSATCSPLPLAGYRHLPEPVTANLGSRDLVVPLARGEDPRTHIATHHPQGGLAELPVERNHRIAKHGDRIVANVGV